MINLKKKLSMIVKKLILKNDLSNTNDLSNLASDLTKALDDKESNDLDKVKHFIETLIHAIEPMFIQIYIQEEIGKILNKENCEISFLKGDEFEEKIQLFDLVELESIKTHFNELNDFLEDLKWLLIVIS